ncbi:GTPase-activating protein [Martiniozyma asiatica (nom. inval.)]|nr:GTPase-activating protein [Martiniozyma asiatica]
MSFTDRRPSMAERRPSFIPHSNSRRPSVIPTLAGIEKPQMSELPKTCDVLICGTGIVESILAAALAWQGSNILHIDANPYYGDHCATLTIEQIKAWCQNASSGSVGFKNFENVELDIPSDILLISKDYGIDLTPKILFAKSDLLTLLINSRVFQYLEFQSISNYHTYEDDSFGKLVSSKEEIFTTDSLNLLMKRQLMKFMKFIFQFDDPLADKTPLIKSLDEYKEKFLTTFIKEKFKLNDHHINELVYALGLSASPDIKTMEGLTRIKRYLISFNIYGNFPAIYSKFGGPGELSQGFCRSAAVAGATYKLNTSLVSYDSKTKIANLSDGSKVNVAEQVIISPSQSPENAVNLPIQEYSVSRIITIVDKSCKEWFAQGESASIVVFPPGTLDSNNKYPVQALILGSGSGCCPSDKCLWYLHTINPDLDASQRDLNEALGKMETSILRESENGFDVDLDEDDVQINDNGVSMTPAASERLEQSFKDFVPAERLRYLLKLKFVQRTTTPPFGVIKPGTFAAEKETTSKPGVDEGVVYSSMPAAEMSYDGVVSEAKVLYRKVVGDEEDFFVVDFEDEDEDQEDEDTFKTNLAVVNDESAVVDDSEEEDKQAFN